ncbi:MAG: glycoside hydrolase family 2, partial [Candidatus Omnitrophica bacterium]|nr:glycoside hydrolase family 2 [Candidatus Omnitrophota bacterium]
MTHRANATLAVIVSCFVATLIAGSALAGASDSDPSAELGLVSPKVVSLDGDDWLLATDPDNIGINQKWWLAPQETAVQCKVPWIIQDPFPGYHGVAWYWKRFDAPENPHLGGRTLLHFEAVDYKADVWVNDVGVGSHEGGEAPFDLDITEALNEDGQNILAVRVLNPTDTSIDGIVLSETPHRNKVNAYTAGSSYNHGGIVAPVRLLVVPAVY